MAPSDHAILSASSAHRWLHCTPSALLGSGEPDQPSDAALQGTAAHALAEHKLRRALKQRSKRPVSEWDDDEMETYTDDYRDFVLEQLAKARELTPDPLVLIEQRLDFSHLVPDGFGTGDCLIVADQTLQVIDLKYGLGVVVDAERNPQMMLYALGALRLFDALYDIKTISMTIFQPRRDNISTWTIPVSELNAWAEEVLRPKAALAAKGEGELVPGEWCRFCKLAVRCRARAEANLEIAKYEFAHPAELDDAEVADVLRRIPELTKWANDIQEYATLAAVNQGKVWDGFKLVEGRSIRKYSDAVAVAEAAKAAGYTDIWKPKELLTITGMERLMGKARFAEILGGLVTKPAGKPTLVPESDKRPALNVSTVNEDFAN